MKKLILLGIALYLSFGLCAQEDVDMVKKVILDAYVGGLQNAGPLENIDKGFHPCFQLIGIGQDGSTVSLLPIYNWREMARARLESGKKPAVKTECNFVDVDVTGNAAVAKIELLREGKKIYTDYLSLYKFKEGWRIVSKIYHRH